MNTTQFSLMVYQWIFSKVISSIAPALWKQQMIAFHKGREWMSNIGQFANTLTKDADGNIDMNDLASRIDEMFKVDPVFAYPVNEPMLVLIGVKPEHTFKFDRADADAFLAYLGGRTTTTEVAL